MPSSPSDKPSKDKVYKANPAPVKDPTFDKIGWDKGDFADNRNLEEANDKK